LSSHKLLVHISYLIDILSCVAFDLYFSTSRCTLDLDIEKLYYYYCLYIYLVLFIAFIYSVYYCIFMPFLWLLRNVILLICVKIVLRVWIYSAVFVSFMVLALDNLCDSLFTHSVLSLQIFKTFCTSILTSYISHF